MTERVRGGDGKYLRLLATAEREAHAAELRGRGLSYQKVAETMRADGSASPKYTKADAFHDIEAALKATVSEPAEAARQFELERLDLMHQAALAVLEGHHVTVSNGRIIYLGDQPLPDTGPVLAAIDRMLRISESRRKLLGLDAPVKVDAKITDAMTAEIEDLIEQMANLDAQQAQQDEARRRG